jgi:hypothetical protein
MPDEPEVSGLLALMLLNDARVPARGDGADVVRGSAVRGHGLGGDRPVLRPTAGRNAYAHQAG